MLIFNYKGLPIHYVRYGSGEPVLFIHNGGTSHIIWHDVMQKLKENYEVIALDLPGFGESPMPQSGFTLNDYIDLLEVFIKENSLAHIRLVGNCMGSAMSLGLAIRRPQDICAIVLINPLTKETFSAGWLGLTLWLGKLTSKLKKIIYSLLSHLKLPKIVSKQVLAFQLGSIGRTQKVYLTPELIASFTRAKQMEALIMVLDDVINYNCFDNFQPDIHFAPICTIWGMQNRILSAKAGRRLNKTLRPTREEWFQDCGHLLMMERPKEVADILFEFFSNQGMDIPQSIKA